MLLLAQLAQAGSDGALPATALGVAGVFVAFLQVAIFQLWNANKNKDTQILAMLERVVEATAAIGSAAEAVSTLADRVPTQEEMVKVRTELARARRAP